MGDKKNLRNKITLGLVLVFLGIMLLLSNGIMERREKVFSKMNLELTELLAHNEESDVKEEENTNEEALEEEVVEEVVEQKPVTTTNNNYESYIGVLDIPKIGFSKGFYKKESKLNNVKFNLKILPVSSYPDEAKGNVIIIGHSGNYNNSYFANLYKLNLEDTASITYNGSKYNYKIVDIYTDTKDGKVTIYRNENKSCLTLITCTKDDSTTQTIYILELVNIE
jgi:LPXTG-site transpeptidase (sortase) family protein